MDTRGEEPSGRGDWSPVSSCGFLHTFPSAWGRHRLPCNLYCAVCKIRTFSCPDVYLRMRLEFEEDVAGQATTSGSAQAADVVLDVLMHSMDALHGTIGGALPVTFMGTMNRGEAATQQHGTSLVGSQGPLFLRAGVLSSREKHSK